MTALLPLAGWVIAPLPDGSVRIGTATVPGWVAADLAVRIHEAAGAVPAQLARRVATRRYLDRLFSGAHLLPVRALATRSYARHLAYREGDRAHVRIGDTVTAWCRKDGKRARGMLVEWSHDALHGYVTTTVEGWPRVSVPWVQVERMADRLLEGA